MRRALALALLLLPLAALAGDRPGAGLMWNRSGLPLTFPLQVKTDPGHDYVLTLTEPETGADTLAAYIVGGRFFRVLVPPGTYSLRFDYGQDWQASRDGFADGGTLHLPAPLTFAVQGLGRKAGHLVDLTGLDAGRTTADAATVRAQTLCQVSRSEIRALCPLGQDRCDPDDRARGYTSPYGVTPRYAITRDSYTRLCDDPPVPDQSGRP